MDEKLPSRPIRVMVVDDEELFVRALVALLAEDDRLQIVGTAARAQHAIQQAITETPDVVVLDLGLPDMDGFEVTRRLRGLGVEAHVIILSGFDEELFAADAVEAGAAAYVTKGCIGGELGDTIAAVVRDAPR
jgi:DNA-binding NarL/FixJ family response regulator